MWERENVVRYIGYRNEMRTLTAEWVRLRWVVLERDQFTCRYCGRRAPDVQLQVDHRLAVIDGGTDDEDNLVTACFTCNQGKEYARWAIAAEQRPARATPTGRPKSAPFSGPGSATATIAQLLADNPQVSNQELVSATGVKMASVHVLRHRAKRRLAEQARGTTE